MHACWCCLLATQTAIPNSRGNTGNKSFDCNLEVDLINAGYNQRV